MAELTTMTNQHPDFYRVLGPFLARREVHKQVGGPVYDDDGKTWIVARNSDGQVLGFIGITNAKGTAVAKSCYLVDETDTDLLADLIGAVLATVAPTPVRTTVRAARADAYIKAGFVEAGRTGGFAKLVHPGKNA